MLFNSVEFLFFFFPIFLVFYFLAKKRRYRNALLLLFSLFFYSWGEPRNILLMLIMILLSYSASLLIAKQGTYRKLTLILYLIIALGLLGYFKYYNFIVEIMNQVFHQQFALKTIILPIGISFYTFQCLSYVFDVAMNKCQPQKNILNFACYVSLFPQLIAGPIVRYTTIESELEQRKENFISFQQGFQRFVMGLGKKVIIANNTAIIADNIFNSNIHTIPVNVAWMGAISYAIQIYFDFSGYSDMAIGLGRMFGFHFLENFNYPYISRSITEFWRRWHISLGSWFRDYIYIPLGGNRVSPMRWIINILIVWGLTGLWHGASWNFILWGLYFACLLIIEKKFLLTQLQKHPALSHLYALFFILIGWIIFRCESLGDLFYYSTALVDVRHLGSLSSLIKYGVIENLHFLILGILLSVPQCNEWLFKKIKQSPMLLDLSLTLLLVLCVLFIVNESYSPFIYFRF